MGFYPATNPKKNKIYNIQTISDIIPLILNTNHSSPLIPTISNIIAFTSVPLTPKLKSPSAASIANGHSLKNKTKLNYLYY